MPCALHLYLPRSGHVCVTALNLLKSLNLSLSLYACNNWRVYVKFDLACSCVCIQLPYMRRDDMGRAVVQPGGDIGLQIFFIKTIRYEI
jgi:hypothetical protein